MSTSWSRADIHVHTTASDGHSTAHEVLSAARRAGLDVIAITDHDTITAALEARRLAPRYGVEVIVGEEVSTIEGHLLALFIERRVAPGLPLAETIAEVHAQGGLCIAAHPYGWLVSAVGDAVRTRYATDWPLDGLETFNGSLPVASMNRRAAALATATGLAALGGSDSHHAATVGTGVTLFPGTCAADLRTAILARQTIAQGCGWGSRQQAMYLVRSFRKGVGSRLRPATTSIR
jgi:predicted metal-dependent phosphoesterase TrpH